jgi:hypothetical protein
MASFDPRLEELYLNKPECVIGFPEWLLSGERIEECRRMPRLAIVEIAGRDSIAAAVKSVREESLTDLLPTYVYTGTEHGPWPSVNTAIDRLAMCLPEIQVHRPMVLGSPGFWQALNGRFISELVSRYGFYTPCIGCHAYLHSVRIPLALSLGGVPVISGEREFHDGATKVNQNAEALDFYQSIGKDYGIRFAFSLRYEAKGDHISDILGFEWQEGKDQLGCVLSGNYRGLDGSASVAGEQVLRYVEEFAGPCVKRMLDSYVTGKIPDHLKIAAQVLARKAIP